MSIPELVSAFYSRIWNAGDLAAIDELIAEEFSFRGSLGTEVRGRDGFREYVSTVRSSLADYRCDILECVAMDDQAFAKMRFHGRHVGTFRGFAPTGKHVEWLGAALFTLGESRIRSVWVLGDLAGLDALLRHDSENEQHDMQQRYDMHTVPEGLPVPADDGACDHLPGNRLHSIPLNATDGRKVDLSTLSGRTVLFIYPRTGRPDQPGSDDWDAIPGARGCTPQSCGFRDHYAELRALGASAIFGLSTQSTEYQREAVERLHLPFALLSDDGLALTRSLNLPTFDFEPYRSEQRSLLKRMAWIIRDGRIEKVFYPVFPPDRNASDVIAWLRANPI